MEAPLTTTNESTNSTTNTDTLKSSSGVKNKKIIGSTIGRTSAQALECLLEEDPLLSVHKLTILGDDTHHEAAFGYAASLLHADSHSWSQQGHVGGSGRGGSSSSNGASISELSQQALAEVDRKLALVTSLAERISREKPEHVAAPLLQLHGYSTSSLPTEESNNSSTSTTTTTTTTLVGTRDRCQRLTRQAHVLDSVAQRVESTLVRGLTRMDSATSQLEQVLSLSNVLKLTARLVFESKKVVGGPQQQGTLESLLQETTNSISMEDDEEEGSKHNRLYAIDLQELTRAASSVAILEELLSSPELTREPIAIVEELRPPIEQVAQAVRVAANRLLNQSSSPKDGGAGSLTRSSTIPSAMKLGATLQVYFHLQELPHAAWSAVTMALERAEKASSVFLNPSAISRLFDKAESTAKDMAHNDAMEHSSGAGVNKQTVEMYYQRHYKNQLREAKRDAAEGWARGLLEASLSVWNLHRVLVRKSDPVSRVNFWEVVKVAPVPDKFQSALEWMERHSKTNGTISSSSSSSWTIFSLFWNQVCISLGGRIQKLLKYEGGKMTKDLAAFYPAIRSAALDLLTSIEDSRQAGNVVLSSSASAWDDFGGTNSASWVGGGGSSTGGILGGSSGLEDMHSSFGWSSHSNNTKDAIAEKEQGFKVSSVENEMKSMGFSAVSADTWTVAAGARMNSDRNGGLRSAHLSSTTSALSTILSSPEWMALEGSGGVGLYPLQKAFTTALKVRLEAPLSKMFVENPVVDENGIAISVLSTLPSNKDMKALESCLRIELSQADPREGGGDLSMTTMISENIVDMVENFCDIAKNATSGASENKLLREKGTPTEELLHDIKVAGILVRILKITLNFISVIFQFLTFCVLASKKGFPHEDPSRVTREHFYCTVSSSSHFATRRSSKYVPDISLACSS